MNLSDLIRTDTPLSVGTEAKYPYSPSIERKYRFISNYDEEVLLHRIEADAAGKPKFIYLPRALCPVGGVDLRVEGMPVTFPSRPTPKPEQVAVFNETAAFLKAGQSGLVEAYTGWGKTVLGYFAAASVGRKTLVITTKDDIYQQWIDTACGRVSAANPDGVNMLGLAWEDIGEIRQDKCEVGDTKFIVAMIHSLSKEGRYPEWIDNDIGLVIYDECHRVPAEQFSVVATRFRAKLRLGLSATMDRPDGKQLVIQSHIGPVRAHTDVQLRVPKVLCYRTAWQCPRVFRTNKKTGAKKVVRLPHEPGKTTHIEKIIAADPQRNQQIAEIIKTAHAKGRKIVIFSTLLDHLRTLQRAAIDCGVPGKDTGIYTEASTKEAKADREKVKVKPVIFTTYIMMGEGTNIPWLDTCILAMPRAQVEQPCGRIRRDFEGKKEPLIIDLLDADSFVFVGYAVSRRAWYKSIGSTIIDMD